MNSRRSLVQIWLICIAILQALTSVAQPVTKVAAGYDHSLFIKSNGSLWGMGVEYFGELGNGDAVSNHYIAVRLPEQIAASDVTTVAVSDYISLFLKNNGSLWAMGENTYGQLGDGSSNNAKRPEQIVASNVIAIAAGDSHCLFLKSDGSLWAMGHNNYGQLGDGSYDCASQPEQIVASNVTAIAAGYDHSLFIKSDGSLWAMGDNTWGQLGDGTRHDKINRPEMIVSNGVAAIAAGESHSLFIKSDGSLWGMGERSWGELGGTNIYNTGHTPPEMIVASNVTAIAAGGTDTLFIKSDGSLWAMGFNAYGQLGDGTQNVLNRQPEQIVASNVVAISAGYQHSMFVKSDGSLWAMGMNRDGRLGDGTENATNRPVEIVAGDSTNCNINPLALVVTEPPGYNLISGKILDDGKMCLSFVGIAGTKYALDRSFSLSPANWVPQETNSADSFGALVFTNTIDVTTNNFWRIRSVPLP